MKTTLIACVLTAAATTAGAQSLEAFELDKVKKAGLFSARIADVLELQPLVPKPGVRNAPFTADAVTEFTQVLGDGNRIERSYTTSVARDSQGRTRRAQEIAMVGPLANLKVDDARLVVITDSVTGAEYTLDERTRTARRSSAMQLKVVEIESGKGPFFAYSYVTKGGSTAVVDHSAKVTTQTLGTRTIEGVQAEGTRTTTTIAAGAIGNVNAIDVVMERWYAKDLQMDVLISRRDPRNGDTVYQLRNIVRAEPPADLFGVPAGYTMAQPARRVWVAAPENKLVERQRWK